MLCFHFYSILHIFKISFEVSSLTHELFRTVLFNFQVFGTFSVALVSSLILLWFNNINNFNSFKFCSLIYDSRYGLSSHIQRSKQRSLVGRGGRGNTGIGKWKIQNIECKIGSRMYCTTQAIYSIFFNNCKWKVSFKNHIKMFFNSFKRQGKKIWSILASVP